MSTLHEMQRPQITGNPVVDDVAMRIYEKQKAERDAVEVPDLTQAARQYQQSLQAPEVQADRPSDQPRTIELTGDDDFLPYLQDVQDTYDLREQAYQDQREGRKRPDGDVSLRFAIPKRKTIHGIDIATGEKLLDRPATPLAEEKYQEGVQQLRETTFNVNEGYNTPEAIEALGTIAEGTIIDDGTQADFERKINLMGVPPEQARLAWEVGQMRQGIEQIEEALATNLALDDLPETVDEPDIDQDELPTVGGWEDATRLIYQAEEGRPFEGTTEQLIDWYTEQMSSFNWKIGAPGINTQGMAYYMMRAMKEDESYAKALLTMIDIYDRVRTNWGIVGENIQQLLTDPVNLVGVPGAGALGVKAAGVAAKGAMRKWLQTRLGQAVAGSASAGAVNTAVHTGGAEAGMQRVEQAANMREDLNLGQVASSAAFGAAAGAVLGPAFPLAGVGMAKLTRRVRQNLRNAPPRSFIGRQLGAVGDVGGVIPFRARVATSQPEISKANSLDAAFDLAATRRYPNMREFKQELQDRVQSAAKKAKVNLKAPESNQFLREAVVADAIRALQSNSNAVGWYDRTVSEALDVLGLIHPEIKTDEESRFAFIYALAVTSNGMKVDANFGLAERAYRSWKENGVMPTNIGQGNASAAINKSLKMYNDLAGKLGAEELRKVMLGNFTVRQLERAGFKVTGEYKDTVVRGAAILGPKIGNGFFSNLYGHFDQLTMDRWLMRTWGRLTGTLIEKRPDLVREKTSALQEVVGRLKSDPESVRALKDIGVNVNTRSMKSLATQIQKSSMLPANRAAMAQLGTDGDLLRRVGNGLAKDHDGQKEAPTTADRNRIRGVFQAALQDVRAQGYPDMTMADLQALLWYPEKRLYDRATAAGDVAEGYADDEAPDYANAAINLARKLGISDDEIQREVKNGRARRARPADVDAGERADTEQGRSFTGRERKQFLRESAYRKERNRLSDNGGKRLYQERSGGGTGEAWVLKVYEPTKPYAKLAADVEASAPTFVELKPGDETRFRDALGASKRSTPYGAAVHLYDEAEYRDMRLFQTEDGLSGFALKPDGDIVSVYSGGGNNVLAIIQMAVDAGGTKLDCFDTILPSLYRAAGFRETERFPWDDQFAPPDWDKAVFAKYNNGEPDLVMMQYEPREAGD